MTDPNDQHLLEAIVSVIEEHADQMARIYELGDIDSRQYRVRLSELWPQLGGIAKHYELVTSNANAARINAAVMRAMPHLAEPDIPDDVKDWAARPVFGTTTVSNPCDPACPAPPPNQAASRQPPGPDSALMQTPGSRSPVPEAPRDDAQRDKS